MKHFSTNTKPVSIIQLFVFCVNATKQCHRSISHNAINLQFFSSLFYYFLFIIHSVLLSLAVAVVVVVVVVLFNCVFHEKAAALSSEKHESC